MYSGSSHARLRVGAVLGGLAGIVLCVALFRTYGVSNTLQVLVRAGWLGAAAIVLIHLPQMVCSALGWRAVVAGGEALPRRQPYLLLRWIRESVNNLLPLAQIGGEVVAARLLRQSGARLSSAMAGITADLLLEAATQVLFTLFGLIALLRIAGASSFVAHLEQGLLLAAVLVGAVFVGVRRGWTAVLERMIARIASSLGWRPGAAALAGWHTALLECLQRPRAVTVSALWHLLAWLLGSAEVWLVLHLLGQDVSLSQALIIESLGQGAKSLGFAVPAAIGVQEGGYVLVCRLLGIPAEVAMAASLLKRMRELALGVPGLILWHRTETKAVPASEAPLPGDIPARGDPMIGTSWTHRLARLLVRPLLGTSVRPNHLTTLRLLTGVAACAAFVPGTRTFTCWGGGLWVASAFLDRADGELARIGSMMSAAGHRYDYFADTLVNTLFFLCIGIGLRDSWLGYWSIALGVTSALCIWLCSLFSEWLEARSPPGTRAYSGRWGFDPDDALYLMGPLAWLGWLEPVLIGASVGSMVMMLITGIRLLRLKPAAGQASEQPDARDPRLLSP